MSIQLTEYINQTLEEAYNQFDLNGGSLRFYVWQLREENEIKQEQTTYNIHKVVARQTIEKLNYETAKRWNSVVSEYKRSEYPILQIDYDKLDESGIKLSTDDFLGYEYDWINNQPIFKGKKNGKGTYTWPDGSYYEGFYKNDLKHGQGKFKSVEDSYW